MAPVSSLCMAQAMHQSFCIRVHAAGRFFLECSTFPKFVSSIYEHAGDCVPVITTWRWQRSALKTLGGPNTAVGAEGGAGAEDGTAQVDRALRPRNKQARRCTAKKRRRRSCALMVQRKGEPYPPAWGSTQHGIRLSLSPCSRQQTIRSPMPMSNASSCCLLLQAWPQLRPAVTLPGC